MRYAILESPVGPLCLAAEAGPLEVLAFAGSDRPSPVGAGWQEDPAAFQLHADELAAYFAGRLERFSFPVAPAGTPFQREVWQALTEIPYGETISYGELARRIGRPRAVRAVGLANGANPVAIVVPCHRVIGSNGTLTGYGGGVPAKQYLLALERGQPSLL